MSATQDQIDASTLGDDGQPIVKGSSGEVDERGELIVGGADPENGADAALPSAAPRNAQEAATETVKKVTQSRQRYAGNSRQDIYKKRDAMPLQQRQSLEKNDPSALAILEAQAGGEPLPEPVEDAEDAAAVAAAALAPASPAQAPVAAPAAPVASERKRYKLNVYGQEQEASEDAVIQAGIAALQKTAAGDVRMHEAATYEARLKQWERQLQAYADSLSGTGGAPQPGKAEQPAATPEGVAGQIDKEKVKQALDFLAQGDTDRSSSLMNEVISAAVTAGLRESAPAAPASAPRKSSEVPALSRVPSDPWGTDQRDAANRVFNTEFSSFDDAQFETARNVVSEAMNDPDNYGKDLATIVRSTCRTVARLTGAHNTAAPAQAPVAPSADLTDRRALKARLPLSPPPSSGRAPSAAKEVRYPSNKEYVQGLNARRGSNSAR